MLWRYKEEVTLSSFNKNHVDVTVKNKYGDIFRLTGVYGEPDRRKRHETWHLLRTLSTGNSMPWCLIGVMNNVTSQNDKLGGRPYPQALIQGFQDVLEDCGLRDMPLIGHQFTWERGTGTTKLIKVRLDRALVSAGFISFFTEAKLINLEVSTSDHSLILLELRKPTAVTPTRRFRFENAWLREPICQQIVTEVWITNSKHSLYMKLQEFSDILSKWGQQITGNFK